MACGDCCEAAIRACRVHLQRSCVGTIRTPNQQEREKGKDMRTPRALRPIAIAIALASTATGASATDGYFAEGYGMRARGMGGA